MAYNGTELPNDSDSPVRILVPIRDPSNPPSKRALEHAMSLLKAGGELINTHINLYHERNSTRGGDLKQTISPNLGNIDANYVVRRGVSIEDIILEEAIDNDVDLIVVGENDQSQRLQTINRVLGAKVDVATNLHERVACTVDVGG